MPVTASKITATELARRLCVEGHYGTFTGHRGPTTVPCAYHIGAAQRYWGLIQPEGVAFLRVLVQAAKEEGLLE